MRWKSEWHPDWQRKFALFPVVLNDKTTIWLEFYYQRYVEITEIDIRGSRIVGRWDRVKRDAIKHPTRLAMVERP